MKDIEIKPGPDVCCPDMKIINNTCIGCGKNYNPPIVPTDFLEKHAYWIAIGMLFIWAAMWIIYAVNRYGDLI